MQAQFDAQQQKASRSRMSVAMSTCFCPAANPRGYSPISPSYHSSADYSPMSPRYSPSMPMQMQQPQLMHQTMRCSMEGRAAAPAAARLGSRKRPAESPPPKGRSNAARVSRGSEFDVWNGLTVAQPKRNKSEHVTITVVIYNTCEGGVPTEEDVVAAIDDLEELYAACSVKGRLADAPFGFMKEKLAVDDMVAVTTKLATQPPPFVPSSVDVANAFTFPSDSVPAS